MAGQVQPQGLLLAREAFVLRPLDPGPEPGFDVPAEERVAEHVVLARGCIASELLGGEQGVGEAQRHRRPGGSQPVERAGPYEGFHHSPIDLPVIDATGEVEEVRVRSVPGAFVDDVLERGFACPLDRAEPVPDAALVGHAEAMDAFVDVRRCDGEAQRATLLDQVDDLVGAVHVGGQHRRHECGWMVRLEPRGLVRQQRVRGGVRLVEAVSGELFHQVEDVRGPVPVHPPARRAVHEHAAVLGHLLGLLLAHRAAQQIGLAQRVAGEHLSNLHHLLLIQDDPVGRLENGFELRVQVLDRRLTVLASDEVLDHSGLERAGTEQRNESDDVVEAVGEQAPDKVPHPA